jgi:hypothetical protein
MAQAFGQVSSLPFALGIFYSRADAIAWLNEEGGFSEQAESMRDD